MICPKCRRKYEGEQICCICNEQLLPLATPANPGKKPELPKATIAQSKRQDAVISRPMKEENAVLVAINPPKAGTIKIKQPTGIILCPNCGTKIQINNFNIK